MAQVTFTGRLVIPETDVETFDVPLNEDKVIDITPSFPIILHAIYVSNPNPVAVTVTIEPLYKESGKVLRFKGIFGNKVETVPFWPPIGPFPQGRVKVYVEAPSTADKPVTIAFQYTAIQGGD